MKNKNILITPQKRKDYQKSLMNKADNLDKPSESITPIMDLKIQESQNKFEAPDYHPATTKNATSSIVLSIFSD